MGRLDAEVRDRPRGCPRAERRSAAFCPHTRKLFSVFTLLRTRDKTLSWYSINLNDSLALNAPLQELNGVCPFTVANRGEI